MNALAGIRTQVLCLEGRNFRRLSPLPLNYQRTRFEDFFGFIKFFSEKENI